MSFLKYLFDNDRRQRDDIEELREMQFRMAGATTTGGASERWVGEIADEVKELAATVNVLMRKLAATGQLDLAAVQAEVAEELRPKPRKREARAAKPEEPGHPAACLRCRADGMTNEMVKVGADWMCRSCAKNP